jgi:hypothetical protein
LHAFGDRGEARQRWQLSLALPSVLSSRRQEMREHSTFTFADEAVSYEDISAMFEP